MESKAAKLVPYNPYSGKSQPVGFALCGFFDECDVLTLGKLAVDQVFFDHLDQFLGSYKNELPPWSDFINSWRHFIGFTYFCLYVPPEEGSVTLGFLADFGVFYEPAWLVPRDLNINVIGQPEISQHTLFWQAFQQFIKRFRFQEPLTSVVFFSAWHQFIQITAVLYDRTASLGDYKTLNIPSYEAVFRSYFSERAHQSRFRPLLRAFYDEIVDKEGYFLPSHFFEQWQLIVQKEYNLLNKLEKSSEKEKNKLT